MPCFPTQTVGTPTNRGKARRYTGKGIGLEQDGEMNSPLQKREGSKRQDGALKGRRYKRRGQSGSSPAAQAEEDALEAVAPGHGMPCAYRGARHGGHVRLQNKESQKRTEGLTHRAGPASKCVLFICIRV